MAAAADAAADRQTRRRRARRLAARRSVVLDGADASPAAGAARSTARTTASSSPASGSAHVDGRRAASASSATLGRFVRVERAGAVAGDERFAFFVRRMAVHATDSLRWPSRVASFWWARCDLDFTVPNGMSSFSEISLCVMPSRCCMRTIAASSDGSSSIARRTRQTASSVSSSGGRRDQRRRRRARRRRARSPAGGPRGGRCRSRRAWRSSPATAPGRGRRRCDRRPATPCTKVCWVASSARSARPSARSATRVHEASVLAVQRSDCVRVAASEGVEHVGVHRAPHRTASAPPGRARARPSRAASEEVIQSVSTSRAAESVLAERSDRGLRCGRPRSLRSSPAQS